MHIKNKFRVNHNIQKNIINIKNDTEIDDRIENVNMIDNVKNKNNITKIERKSDMNIMSKCDKKKTRDIIENKNNTNNNTNNNFNDNDKNDINANFLIKNEKNANFKNRL